MKHLKYITETHEGNHELVPNWNAVAILTETNGIKKYEDSHFELHPVKAFMFDNIDTCDDFIKNFDKIEHRYDDILPEDTVYYIVHDLTILKAQPDYNYVDRLLSKSFDNGIIASVKFGFSSYSEEQEIKDNNFLIEKYSAIYEQVDNYAKEISGMSIKELRDSIYAHMEENAIIDDIRLAREYKKLNN